MVFRWVLMKLMNICSFGSMCWFDGYSRWKVL